MARRVVVTDHAFSNVLHERAVADEHKAEFVEAACVTEEETIDVVRGAHVAFVNFAPMSRATLAVMAPGATVIRYGVGYDNVDLDGARELGIQVANVPDYGIQTVADHAAASLIALGRRLKAYDEAIRRDGWVSPAGLGPVRSFRDSTIGLVGMGKIAQAVVERLAPFGFTFICHDPYASAAVLSSLNVEAVSLDELARRAHAVSLHAPSTP